MIKTKLLPVPWRLQHSRYRDGAHAASPADREGVSMATCTYTTNSFGTYVLMGTRPRPKIPLRSR
jgi:hypothetical protein